MSHTLSVTSVGLTALLLNVPLGMWRSRTVKFSPAWFVAVHASIPVIVTVRILLGVRWVWIPLMIGLAVAGQLIGGVIRRR